MPIGALSCRFSWPRGGHLTVPIHFLPSARLEQLIAVHGHGGTAECGGDDDPDDDEAQFAALPKISNQMLLNYRALLKLSKERMWASRFGG